MWYSHTTRFGRFTIHCLADGNWLLRMGNDAYGQFSVPELAAKAVRYGWAESGEVELTVP